MYMEDVDLSLRARVAGGICLAACEAEAVHDWKMTLPPRKFELLERNRRALWHRFFGRSARMYPLLLQAELMGWAYAVTRGTAYLRAKVRAGRRPPRSRLPPQLRTNDVHTVLARTHPYAILFPDAPIIPRLGRLADRLFAITAPAGRPSAINDGSSAPLRVAEGSPIPLRSMSQRMND